MTKTDFQAKINEDKRYNPGRAVLCEKIGNTSCGGVCGEEKGMWV